MIEHFLNVDALWRNTHALYFKIIFISMNEIRSYLCLLLQKPCFLWKTIKSDQELSIKWLSKLAVTNVQLKRLLSFSWTFCFDIPTLNKYHSDESPTLTWLLFAFQFKLHSAVIDCFVFFLILTVRILL